MQRLITRHTNRKLYDPHAKRYVSLADIVSLIVQGDSVRVIEHPTGEDATPRVLAQALVDLVKRRARSLPQGLMETLLRLASGARTASTSAAAAIPRNPSVQNLASRARKEAETIATRLVARGRLGIEEALHLRKEVENAIQDTLHAAEAATRAPLTSALAPGRSVQTIAGLARELKELETMVALPRTKPSPKRGKTTRGVAASSSSSRTTSPRTRS